eukprot:8518436-Alexandrium_andersonii.AAC.1
MAAGRDPRRGRDSVQVMQYLQAYLQERAFDSIPDHQGVQYAICSAFGGARGDSGSDSEDIGAA